MSLLSDLKNALHVVPASSDALGAASSTDPVLLIEAQFSLDKVLPLLNFYDNGRAQDLLAILLTKAAELAAGGVITPALSAAIAATQGILPAFAPVTTSGALTPSVVDPNPAQGFTPAAPAVIGGPVVLPSVNPLVNPAANPALPVTHVVDPSTGAVVPVAVAVGPVTHVVDPATGVIVPLPVAHIADPITGALVPVVPTNIVALGG